MNNFYDERALARRLAAADAEGCGVSFVAEVTGGRCRLRGLSIEPAPGEDVRARLHRAINRLSSLWDWTAAERERVLDVIDRVLAGEAGQ